MGKWWDEFCESEQANGDSFGAENERVEALRGSRFGGSTAVIASTAKLTPEQAKRQSRALVAVFVGTGLVLGGVTIGIARAIDKEQERLTPGRRY